MSKYIKQEVKATVPKHRHCVVCSTPISFDKEFCGPNCEDQFKRTERKRKYTFIVILLMFPVLFLVLTLFRRWPTHFILRAKSRESRVPITVAAFVSVEYWNEDQPLSSRTHFGSNARIKKIIIQSFSNNRNASGTWVSQTIFWGRTNQGIWNKSVPKFDACQC